MRVLGSGSGSSGEENAAMASSISSESAREAIQGDGRAARIDCGEGGGRSVRSEAEEASAMAEAMAMAMAMAGAAGKEREEEEEEEEEGARGSSAAMAMEEHGGDANWVVLRKRRRWREESDGSSLLRVLCSLPSSSVPFLLPLFLLLLSCLCLKEEEEGRRRNHCA
jgi:hypothetical protein